jgi:hypothetical protein
MVWAKLCRSTRPGLPQNVKMLGVDSALEGNSQPRAKNIGFELIGRAHWSLRSKTFRFLSDPQKIIESFPL